MIAFVVLTDGTQVDIECDKFQRDCTGSYAFLKSVEKGTGTWGYPDLDSVPVAFFETARVICVIDSRNVIIQKDDSDE